MNRKLGFIGLGQMGSGMAANLVKAECDVTVFDLGKKQMDQLISVGASSAESPKKVAEKVDWVFLSLPGTEEVKDVIFGSDGIMEGNHEGLVIIDLSTTHPLATREIASQLKAKGVDFLDAPVSGMQSRAEEGTLTVMVGGDEKVFKEVKNLFDYIGKNVHYMGNSGNGQLTKLTNQLLFNINTAAIAEILPMAVKMGLDPEKVCNVVQTGTGKSFALEFFTPLILEGNFDPGYHLTLAYKDMVSAYDISSHNKIPLPLTTAATNTYQLALSQGLGEENKGAMIKVWEKVLGVNVRKKKS